MRSKKEKKKIPSGKLFYIEGQYTMENKIQDAVRKRNEVDEDNILPEGTKRKRIRTDFKIVDDALAYLIKHTLDEDNLTPDQLSEILNNNDESDDASETDDESETDDDFIDKESDQAYNEEDDEYYEDEEESDYDDDDYSNL